MNILMVGDIVGKGGRRAVAELVPHLRRDYDCSFAIANGENMAGGGGLTRKCLNSVLRGEIDAVTTGDHVWDQRDFATTITEFDNVLRPANVHPDQPGRGYGIFELPGGVKVGVVNLLGRTFMKTPVDSPFTEARSLINRLREETPIVFVDFHAEATSEKIAMGRFLDGWVTAVLGTHTHVATADEQIFPGGTAFQCDVGMVGSRESILGRAVEPVVSTFSTGMPSRFTVVEKGIRLHATVVGLDPDTGKARSITRVTRDWD